ncbi:MAG: Fic family protein [Magnetococcales bacterium]|nr:Fic family protein [Magnetococcales bacterium]
MVSKIPFLPFEKEIETRAVLKKLAQAHRALAELKGVATGMPNQNILISTLSLQEAKDSSAIENIITTHDDLYRSDSAAKEFLTIAAKEVHNYAEALRNGFEQVKQTGLLTLNDILVIHETVEENDAGFRKLPGTELKNEQTGEVIYTPPQHPDEINTLLANLEHFINNDEGCDWDPLTRMAVIHHQFETIHPFYDGNGRTGRIINILYLVKQGMLEIPILYLSRYINRNKTKYYELLQTVRTYENWEAWLLYLLTGVEQTARQTIELVTGIKKLMQHHKHQIRDELPKIYSQDLINNLFRHPYTKIEFVELELRVHRNTAAKYLDAIVKLGLLSKHRLGKENYYINEALFNLLIQVSELSQEEEVFT